MYDVCERQFGHQCENPLKIYIPTEPVIPLLEISPIKPLTFMHTDVHGKMFTTVLFVMAKIMEEKFTNEEMVRQIVTQPSNRISCSCPKE